MHPLEFHPIFKRIRWGGRRLGDMLGKPIGDADDYAESWEIADHGDDQSLVAHGDFTDWSLDRLMKQHGRELLGRHASLDRFPLLVKFLDAQDRLSVQVHPNDEQAPRYDPADLGKTEAWVVLDAQPESRIFAGLAPGVNSAMLRAHLASGEVEKCLHAFRPRPGDCVFIPAGTVHALGEGILIAEIQQTSDITFRLFDWNRVDRAGKPRDLHIEHALEVIDFSRGPVDSVRPEILEDERGHRLERLVRCEHFELRRRTTKKPFKVSPQGSFRILMMLEGDGTLCWDDHRRTFPRGRTVLLPAASPDVRIEPRTKTTLLEAFRP